MKRNTVRNCLENSETGKQELSNHHRRSPSISVAEIIFTATDCFIWRKHHHRNHNHWWMITQSELRTQSSHSIGRLLIT
ncbi:hypothetical protein P8452_71505 [Trifolium repens]|nr:hypothetical protein P8452_71505 [Trifolium repens]